MKNTQSIKISAIGVGGSGNNAINRMIKDHITGVHFIAANTDIQDLSNCKAPIKVQLGPQLTNGLGAGANPVQGTKAAIESADTIKRALKGTTILFITCGMGGGTGTGASPIIAKIAREMHILTVGVVTRPFTFEGSKRTEFAAEGIATLKKYVDTLVVIANNKLLEMEDQTVSMISAFHTADSVLQEGVRGISDLIIHPGYINIDFSDIKNILQNKGLAVMGVGIDNGDDRIVRATKEAMSSPLLDVNIDGAKQILLNIATGDKGLLMGEIDQASKIVQQITSNSDTNIIFGTSKDNKLGNNVKVTVIATDIAGDVQRVSPIDSMTKTHYNMLKSNKPKPHLMQPGDNRKINSNQTHISRPNRERIKERREEETYDLSPMEQKILRQAKMNWR